MKMREFVQMRKVKWLNTPRLTVWILTPKSQLSYKNIDIEFIIPKDEKLRTTEYGVRLDKHKDLFIEIFR
jgi:hypothetical protein